MVEVAPVTSITPTMDCPTFSQAQQLLLLVFFPHSLEAKFFSLFKWELFSNNSNGLIPLVCCFFPVLRERLVLFLVFPLSHKHPNSQFKPNKSSFVKVTLCQIALCDFVPLFHTYVCARTCFSPLFQAQ